ncbi:MAG TPA: carbonic anhydrase family protein [Isosphaeraceae bacterium]
MRSIHKTTRTEVRRRLGRVPSIEGLEPRVVPSGTTPRNAVAAALGTIQGRVLDEATGRGLAGVRIQLIHTDGRVVRTTATGAGGRYRFRVREDGAYVVREVVPRRFMQTGPTFIDEGPQGGFIPPFGNNSWTYTPGNSNPAAGPVGPEAWNAVAPAGNLPFQSPIDITGATTDLGSVLTVHYGNAVPRQIVNNGHQIQVQFPSAGSTDTITIGGQGFTLAHFHFHDPSETTVDGRAFPLEEHFVNTAATGAQAVVAVFFQVGAHNPALDPVLDAAAASLTRPNSATTIATPVDFAGLLPSDTRGWFYEGSLTTPPLSGPIHWFVFATPITLDAQQLATYQSVAATSGFLPNARPVQPLDGRRLNEIDYDVDFHDQTIAGLDFTLTRRPRAGAARS